MNLAAIALAAVLSVQACQKEYVYVNQDGDQVVTLEEGEGIIKIGLSNTGVGTKAVRPVGSSAADNNVNKVQLVAYCSENDGSTYTVDANVKIKGQENMIVAWSQDLEEGVPGTEEHLSSQKVTLTGLQKDKKYKFVAIGYNASGDESSYGAFTDGDNDGVFTTATAITEQHMVEELFAGTSNESQTNNQGMFTENVSVTLTRQVAGMLGYFQNVPTKVGEDIVQYVKVYANAKYSTFQFPASDDFNGVAEVGSSQKSELLVFDMSKIATNWLALEQTAGYYTFNTVTGGSLSATGTVNQEAKPFAENFAHSSISLVANSIFGGCYIIPYGADKSGSTLTIELVGTDGSKVLKTFTVKTDQSGYSDPKDFDICCNNFYSIGKKMSTEDTDGGKPEDPDKPIDLSGNADITVTINDQWEVLHNMGIE